MILPQSTPQYDQNNENQTRAAIEREDRRNQKIGVPLTIPIVLPLYTAAGLPSASAFRFGLAGVSDANATTRLAVVAGGGANKVVVFSDGTNWLIL